MTLETSTTMSQETLDELQMLIRMNIDSRDGFREAAQQIDDPALATAFKKIATERAAQASDLQHYVVLNDEAPRREGSMAAALHRTWIKVREALTGNDRHAVLAECERGEDHIKAAYEKALKTIPGSPVNDLLQKQYVAVKATHDAVRDLRDACA